MKERFSTEEWEDLKTLPIVVCVLTAAADGKVDQKEAREIVRQLREGAALKDELHRELIVDLASSGGVAQKGMDRQGAENIVERVKGALKAKLSDDEYQRFISSLFLSGMRVASSSGGFLGMGDKVSKEEKAMLGAIATLFDLDPVAIRKHFG